jgi:serine/threonine protein kinase/Flp pilus assembly protein TadD
VTTLGQPVVSSVDEEAPTGFLPPRESPAPSPDKEAATMLGGDAGAAPARPPSTGDRGRQESSERLLEIGHQFGPRYHITKLLGMGGMGAVYAAWDAELEILVALKVIRYDHSDPVQALDIERRFKRELLLARTVTHPNVVRIHDLGDLEGVKYITMTYVDGEDLLTLLRREGKLSIPRAIAIARQIISGLKAAHDAGVVHRDLKPANIMLDKDGTALIMDFGIAHSVSDKSGAGLIVGTFEYMPPEQARGDAVDQRADVYSLGLILYEMLLGLRPTPTSGKERLSELRFRMDQALPSPRTIDPAITEPLDKLVAACIQPEREARFESTAVLEVALDAIDDEGNSRPVPRTISRGRLWALAAIPAAIVAVVTWTLGLWTKPAAAPDPVSVLISDFTNVSDPALANVLEQSLAVGLEGASFISAYPRDDALRVAARINAGERLTEDAARLVAMREGLQLVLAGAIESREAGFRISLRGLDPATGNTAIAEEVEARSREDLLPALGRLADDVRRSLGEVETTETSAATEILSASSLDAVREYVEGQELTRRGLDEEAIDHFRRATEIDPDFGRAYSGWGTAAAKAGRREEAETQWKKALSLLDKMNERERYRTLGAYYSQGARNYDKAIENYETLVRLFPADAAAHNNLAVSYFNKLDFQKSRQEGRRALEIYPRNRLYLANSALYAMYASDFEEAVTQAQKVVEQEPSYTPGYLPLAIAALARGDVPAAEAAYARVAGVSARGASLANLGLADIALYEGRVRDAIRLLVDGIDEDERSGNRTYRAVKLVALASAHARARETTDALARAQEALSLSGSEFVAVPVARILADAFRRDEAEELATALSNQLEPRSRAYAKVLDAEALLRRGRFVDAVDVLIDARNLADLWLVRFTLGVAYLHANANAEALSEFDLCDKRRGEATALFLDDLPTYRTLASLPYYLARTQQELGQVESARANYRAFLASQSRADSADALVADARRRLEAL